MKRTGKQTRLSSALDSLVHKLDRKSGGAYSSARVMASWERVAGPMVSSHTTGAHLREGTLIVYVDSPVWANELSSMAEGYRCGVNSDLAQELVREVRFSVSKSVALARRITKEEFELEEFYAPDQTVSVSLSDKEMEDVISSTSMILDNGLREAAIRAAVKDLEWKKGIRVQNCPQKPSEGV
ncbi:MAG: DUF721 domain-containing protein [Coriobacteriia bacterium]|nr:DUF721 domain-containing protein [Coriobacteriia bacterium]